MPEQITLSVNGRSVDVPAGATVAVAIAMAGAYCRKSVTGEPRGVLCAMGICFECRAQIDGVPHQRTCQTRCSAGMQVNTDE
jgi:D-hydroxyproline dehydrogenase subunit gamma